MKRELRREAAALGIVLAVALALRVAYVLSRQGDLLFDYPVVDEERYVLMGRTIAAGQALDPRAFFHPPGLQYALALVFKLAGPGLMAPRIVQALLGTASIALAYVVAKRLVGARVALATAAVCAVHGVLVFECYELLPPVWMLAADLVAIWALLRARETRRWEGSFGAGLALGIAAVFGPTVLPFAALAAWWLRKPALVGAFVGGLALAIAPVTVRNWQTGHEPVLISTNGGINFYIGNNEHYDETLAIRPGMHWDELKDRPQHAGVESENGASAWYYAQGLAFWRDHPGQAAALYLRKVYLYFDGPEIPRDTDVRTLRSGPLTVLVRGESPYVPDGLLVPLALVGMALCWKERRGLWLLYAFIAQQALVLAAFFVTSRYRVPAVPVLAMFACEGLRRMGQSWSEPGSLAHRVTPAVACVALGGALNLPTRESAGHYDAELDFYRAVAVRNHERNPPASIPYFELATREAPDDSRYWFELGNTLDAVGRTRDAIVPWERAGDDDAWDSRARRKAAMALARFGDLDGAIALAEANIASRTRPDSFYAPDHLNLVLLCAKRGLQARALEELAAAARADPRWFKGTVTPFTQTLLGTPGIDAPDLWRALAAADDEAGAPDVAARARARAEPPAE